MHKSKQTAHAESANPQAAAAAPLESAQSPAVNGLGLTERRSSIRPLPVAEAVESDGDTDWAAFQALIAEDTEHRGTQT